jgi:hypothetical protein
MRFLYGIIMLSKDTKVLQIKIRFLKLIQFIREKSNFLEITKLFGDKSTFLYIGVLFQI